MGSAYGAKGRNRAARAALGLVGRSPAPYKAKARRIRLTGEEDPISMTLWIGILLLLLLVAGGLTLVLMVRRVGAEDRRGHLLEVYRAQLSEVDRDLSRGLIDETAAEAARTEISRRILKLEEETPEAAAGGSGRQRVLAPLLGLTVAATALGLYLTLGSPDTPGVPYAAREAERQAAAQEQQAQAPMIQALRQLEQRLEENPEDPEGQFTLAQIYLQLGQPGRSAGAMRRALALDPDNADYHAALGEALILANGGRLSAEARAALDRAIELEPGNPRAGFFLAMALVEQGRREEGLEKLVALLRQAPPDAPWRGGVLRAAQGLAQDLGQELPEDIAQAPQQPAPPFAGGGIEGMDEEQQAMIGEMVAGLAARLEQEPDDLEGWQRLARSYQVLGDPEKQAEALEQIARLQPDEAQAQIEAALALVESSRGRGEALPPEAEPYFARALELQPDSIDARFFLGEYAFQRGEHEVARAYWTPLLTLLPAESDIGGFLRRRLDALESQ